MAAASEFGSFSIREYASRMRSIDVEKSWPFGGGGELKREEIGRLLPPIVCRKYRWWLDEVARSASEVQEDSTPEFQKEDEVAGETAANLTEMSGLGLEKLWIEEAEADLGTGKAVLGLDEDSAVKICPVCGIFAASTVNAVNAHIDGCLVQASRAERRQTREKKAKSRLQKKRSIVELFAVAPQIVTVDEDGEGDRVAGEEDGGCAADAVSKKMRRKKKLKEMMEMMMKKKNQKKKNKKKMMISKKQHRKGILSLLTRLDKKKEKIHKLKMPSEIDYAQILQCSLQNKKLVKKNIDPIGSRKGKSSNINSLLKKNQLKNFRASKSIVKLQTEPSIFPIQSILKDESRATSLQKASSTSKLHGVNLVEQKKVQHSDRHVRFSGKDEFLGHTESWNSSNKLLQMKNVCEGFSDVAVPSSAEDQIVEVVKHIPAVDEGRQVTGSDIDVSVSIMDGSEVQSVQDGRCLADNHGSDAPCPVIISGNRVRHGMGNISFDNSVDLNKPSLHHDSLHLFNPCSSNPSLKLAGFLEPPHYVPNERDLSLHAEGNAQRTMTRGSLHDPFASPFATSTTDSLANITRDSTSRSSLSCSVLNMEMSEKQLYPSPGASPNSNGRALHCQQFRPLSSEDLTNSICFSTAERKKQLSYRSGHYGESISIVDPIFRCSDKCEDEDFIGLPLNSQGELINLHLSGKMGLSQVFKKQNTTFGSVGSFLISNVEGHKSIIEHSNKNDRPHSMMMLPSLKMFPEQHYLKNPTHAPAFSTLGLPAMKNIGRERVSIVAGKEKESSHWLDSELHQMNISCPGCTSYDQCHNHSEKEKDQSMENSNGGFQPIAQPTLRLMGKNVTVGRSNRDGQDFEDGKVWTDKEVITVQHLDHSVPRCFPEGRITHPVSRISEKLNHIVEAQSCPNSPSSFQMKAVEPGSAGRFNCPTHLMSLYALPTINGNRATQKPPLTHPLLNNATKVQKNGYSGTEFVKMSNRIPTQASSSQNDCLQHMMMNSTQSKHNASLTFGAISNFNMSCSNHDSGGHVQPSYMQFSSPVLAQISNAAQQEGTLYSYPSQPPDSFPNHHPCFMSRKNLPPAPPYFTSMFSYPSHRSNITELCLKNPFTVGSSAPPPIPSLPAFKSTSVIKSNCRKRDKLMDIGKFKSTFSKDHGHSKKGKKRPAEKADLSNESVKKPNLEMRNKNIAIGSKNLQELHGYWEKMVDVDFSGKEIVKDGKGSGEKMVDLELSSKEIVKDGLGTAARDNAFKPDGMARSGPIKLSAGAKHVLRPSQTMDPDSLKPTHSTLPCEVVTDTSKIPDFQKKLSKIYRF